MFLLEFSVCDVFGPLAYFVFFDLGVVVHTNNIPNVFLFFSALIVILRLFGCADFNVYPLIMGMMMRSTMKGSAYPVTVMCVCHLAFSLLC